MFNKSHKIVDQSHQDDINTLQVNSRYINITYIQLERKYSICNCWGKAWIGRSRDNEEEKFGEVFFNLIVPFLLYHLINTISVVIQSTNQIPSSYENVCK